MAAAPHLHRTIHVKSNITISFTAYCYVYYVQ